MLWLCELVAAGEGQCTWVRRSGLLAVDRKDRN